ncbi:MAG: hypothetical protein IKT50_05760 [Clostridia bacterium]|nr:hypothetical protein [Clostridia bacterium]
MELKQNIKNNRIVRHTYYFLYELTHRKALKEKASKAIDDFQIPCKGSEERAALISDMLRMCRYYGYTFDEYACFGFKGLGDKKRRTFVSDWEHLGYACAFNDAKNDDVFDDKWQTFSRFGKYYGRDVIFCDEKAGFDAFSEFVKKHSSYIIKPLNLSCGNGVRIISETPEDVEAFYEKLLEECLGSMVVEELIVQIDEMAKFHPSSVNTIRIPTVRLDDQVLVVNPFMRIGQHGKNVDNAGAGGIICPVNVESGELFAAADEFGKSYTVHPESGEKIIGFTVPRWEEAKALVKELATVVPSNRYTGWDVALTEKGWVMVEANRRGQFVWQMATKIGFRDEVNSLLKKIHRKY